MPTLRRSIGVSVTSSSPKRTRPPPSGSLQTGDDAQQRGLAAAGGAEEHDGFAAFDVERRWFQRAAAVGIGLAAALQMNGDAVRGHRPLPAELPRPAMICIATRSGIIMMKNTKV